MLHRTYRVALLGTLCALYACHELVSLPERASSERSGTGDAAANSDSTEHTDTAAQSQLSAAPLKIALLGDEGVNPAARAVLQLIVREHADALIQLGDFAYADASPSGWEAQFSEVLGADFPVFAVIGNHDVNDWKGESGFLAQLQARLARTHDAHCTGDYGVNASCTFRGVFFVLSGVGTYGSDHEAYLESALSQSEAPFRFCAWHKNQHDMQTGAKEDEVGWEAYRTCARHGVPIFTGHEHSYARSMLLTAIGDSANGHGAMGAMRDLQNLELGPGRTVVTVAGLGGQSARERTPDHVSDTWWASIYARGYQLQNGQVQGTQPDIEYGALFLEVAYDGDPRHARAYFKTTGGAVHDTFTLHASVVP